MEDVNMENVERISERIFLFLEKENLSNSDFAAMIGVGAPSISHLKTGRNKLSLTLYAKILESFPQLNSKWLLTGEGGMYDEQREKDTHSIITPNLFSQKEERETRISSSMEDNVRKTTATLEEGIYNTTQKENFVEQGERERKIARVILFYTDGSYEELTP